MVGEIAKGKIGIHYNWTLELEGWPPMLFKEHNEIRAFLEAKGYDTHNHTLTGTCSFSFRRRTSAQTVNERILDEIRKLN